MSACLEAAPPTAPSIRQRTCAPRALMKFEREQLIVDFLNRGVSLAEIAARVGVGEKRMRAIICDPPDWDPVGPPHAASGRGVRSDPGRPSQRGAAGRLRDDGRKPRGGRPGGDNRPRARPLSWGFCRRRAPPLRAVFRASAGGATAYGGTCVCSADLRRETGGEIGFGVGRATDPSSRGSPRSRASRRSSRRRWAMAAAGSRLETRRTAAAAPQDEAAGSDVAAHAERYGRPENPAQDP